MAEGIISLRPHHVKRFVEYYYNFRNVFDESETIQRYGRKFTKKLKSLFDYLVSGEKDENTYILTINKLDSICNMCPIKKETCSNLDSLSIWNGSGEVMQKMDLKEGWLYPLSEFIEKVKNLYPNRNLRWGESSDEC